MAANDVSSTNPSLAELENRVLKAADLFKCVRLFNDKIALGAAPRGPLHTAVSAIAETGEKMMDASASIAAGLMLTDRGGDSGADGPSVQHDSRPKPGVVASVTSLIEVLEAVQTTVDDTDYAGATAINVLVASAKERAAEIFDELRLHTSASPAGVGTALSLDAMLLETESVLLRERDGTSRTITVAELVRDDSLISRLPSLDALRVGVEFGRRSATAETEPTKAGSAGGGAVGAGDVRGPLTSLGELESFTGTARDLFGAVREIAQELAGGAATGFHRSTILIALSEQGSDRMSAADEEIVALRRTLLTEDGRAGVTTDHGA